MGNKRSRSNLVGKNSHLNTLSYIPLSPPQSQIVIKTPAINELPPSRAAPPPTRPTQMSASHCHAATAPPTQKRPLPVTPLPVKNIAAFPAENSGLSQELGECIHRYVDFLKRVGCHHFVKTRSKRGNLANFYKVENHPTRWLLMLYKHQGVPFKFSSPNWSRTADLA